MDMYINIDLLKREREARNWTQQQLADICDLSLRTIQRIEKGGIASKESLASLGSAFNIEASTLLSTEPPTHSFNAETITSKIHSQFLSSIKAVYSHSLVTFSVIILLIGFVGLTNSNLDSVVWLQIALVFSAGVLLTVSVMRRSHSSRE